MTQIPFSNGKVIQSRSSFYQILNDQPQTALQLHALHTHCVFQAQWQDGERHGQFRTNWNELASVLPLSRTQIRRGMDTLKTMEFVVWSPEYENSRAVGISITILNYDAIHRHFQATDQSIETPKTSSIPATDQPTDQATPLNKDVKQGFKQGVNKNAYALEDPILEASENGLSTSNLDVLESVFIPDLDPTPHLEAYHQLINWFYDQALSYGWRKAPPPIGDQMRQTRILLDYERHGYKLWAIREMVEWHVERQRARDRPMVSFDFFDPSRSKYGTPMQEALEATWGVRQSEPPEDSECDVEGLKRLNEMFAEVCPPNGRDAHEERNNRFLATVRKQRVDRQARQEILERLDPPDKTIPTVDDLQPSQYQEAAG